jgi:hypothetical protein
MDRPIIVRKTAPEMDGPVYSMGCIMAAGCWIAKEFVNCEGIVNDELLFAA